MYIYSKTEQLQKTSRAAQAASKACLVCFAVFERCIRYLTRNTYIMVAIEGKPFWTSAYRSFKLLQNNSIRFAAAQGLSSFLLFVAKLGITSFCMLACFLLIEHMPRYGMGGECEARGAISAFGCREGALPMSANERKIECAIINASIPN